MAAWITITGAEPYDGRYEFVSTDELSMQDWEWIKKYTGYVLATLDEEAFGDALAIGVLGLCALHRSGKVTAEQVPEAWAQLRQLPFGKLFGVETDDEVQPDVLPPAKSSGGSESSNRASSPTGSEKSETDHARTGSPRSATSEFAPQTLVS